MRSAKQTKASRDAVGTDGWMLWNAANRYGEEGLDRDGPALQ